MLLRRVTSNDDDVINGNIFRVSDHLCGKFAGNSPVSNEFPEQRPVTRSFDVFFDPGPNQRLSKQSWGWWFETPSCPLWCHCNVGMNNTPLRYKSKWKWELFSRLLFARSNMAMTSPLWTLNHKTLGHNGFTQFQVLQIGPARSTIVLDDSKIGS